MLLPTQVWLILEVWWWYYIKHCGAIYGIIVVKMMACRWWGAKALPEPMLTYCQLDPKEQTFVKFTQNKKEYAFNIIHLKMSTKCWPFCSNINVLSHVVSDILVNTGSGDSLLPDSTKPIHEPILTCHQRDPTTFIPWQCLLEYFR